MGVEAHGLELHSIPPRGEGVKSEHPTTFLSSRFVLEMLAIVKKGDIYQAGQSERIEYTACSDGEACLKNSISFWHRGAVVWMKVKQKELYIQLPALGCVEI